MSPRCFVARVLFALPLGFVLANLGSTDAAASMLTASTILQDFNAVIYTNASTSSDIEGAAVIGGNFSGATIYSNPSASLPAGYGALTVFGNTSGNPITINNGGGAYVGGTKGASINFNGGGYLAAPGNVIGDFETPLNALSASLSTLAATGTLPVPGNNEVIKAIPNASGIAVFNVTAADLAAISSYSIALNGASTVIFNVSGAAVNFNANDESGATGARNIIWNFYNAVSVNIGDQLGGTVLAPDANVSNGNEIDGTLVAESWTGSGELHDYPFDGPLDPTVPEPASWATMLLAAGLASLWRVRARLAASQR